MNLTDLVATNLIVHMKGFELGESNIFLRQNLAAHCLFNIYPRAYCWLSFQCPDEHTNRGSVFIGIELGNAADRIRFLVPSLEVCSADFVHLMMIELSTAMPEQEEPTSSRLPADVMGEVLKHVDGLTLARASCGSSALRDCAGHETLWEHCCNAQWPSTRSPEAKPVIAAAGGFNKLYSACYPLIVAEGSAQLLDECQSDDADDERQASFCSQSLVSFIDVVFAGRSMLAKTVLGVGGVNAAVGDDGDRWFSTCPFRIDLLQQARAQGGELQLMVPIDETSSSNGSLHDKLWRSLWENLRLSWILVDAATHRMANLSSWEPVQGQRQWPTDEDFVIGFGSILPAHCRKGCSVVLCSIVLKCRLLSASAGDRGRHGWALLRLTELSIKLEDMAGSRLNGRDSLQILHAALDCERSTDHGRAVGCYRAYVKAQSELKEGQLRHEKMLDTLALVSAIVALISLTFII